jgi:hypothetical protein
MADHNTRFGREPANPKDLHRPLTAADDLDEVLARISHKSQMHRASE